MRHTGTIVFATALAACLTAALPAAADAIDGNWCDGRGKQLSIEGPQITTPGGTRMSGDYDRHGFRYIVPANDPDPGKEVVMSLIDDDSMTLTRGTPGAREADAPAEIWRRCQFST